MRRSILLLGVVFCLASVISLSPITNAVQAETTREFGADLSSATPQPLQTLEPQFSTQEMLESAEEIAHGYGLETIDGEREWIWTTQGAAQQEYRCPLCDPNTQVFIASFQGTGFWAGPACPGCGPIAINGITIMIDGLSGRVLSVGGGYRSLWSTPVPEITIEPEYTAEPQPTATHVPVTPPPDALSEAELVAIAKAWAVVNGLETFDGPPLVAWMTQSEWENSRGIQMYSLSERAIVFVVAFRGSGIYQGVGGGFSKEPLKMNGFTITLDSLNGHIISTGSGFDAPPFATEYTGSWD